MQLKDSPPAGQDLRRVSGSLAAATAALLGAGTATDVIAQDLGAWEIDTGILYYGESDGRTKDLSFNALLRKELREDRFLNIDVALDSLTGASPSGAAPSNVVQTLTKPSGHGDYTVQPGEQPLDDSFLDTRYAFGATWERPLGRFTQLSLGGNFSHEYDYEHLGINAKIARDFNNRNTTFSAGLAFANDDINPVGGAPIGLSAMLGVEDFSNRTGDKTKDVTDVLLGVTQVINRHTLVQFNYSLSQSDGYLSDPYKILTVVDPLTAALVPDPGGSGRNLYVHEHRPDQRDKSSLFGLVKHDFGGNVLDTSYRYMTDDWGVDSHTIDVRYRWNRDNGRYIEPHVRFYTQTAADFFHTVLLDGSFLPTYASADYRLGDFDAVTLGVKFGHETRRGDMSTRVELYQHTGTPEAAANFGSLAGLDLYPDLTAFIVQVSYSFGH
jgi:hypothetical protein